MTRWDMKEHVGFTQGFIQVWAARMCNTLLPIEVVYWSCTEVYILQKSCGWWKMSSPADLVALVCYEKANEL
jgi:hypothetical protein